MTKLKVGILGATGMVGKELLKVLFDRKFPIGELRLYASEKSAGKKVQTELGEITIENANTADYSQLDIAFFAIGGGWPKENAPKAIEAGCVVIDNSSTFRGDKDVPLIIPEINPQAIGNSKLIANPNCTTAIAVIPLHQIYKNYGLKKVIISTYQSTSGAGNKGMVELEEETRKVLNGEKAGNELFQHPIPFNVIPHIDAFQENRYTKEEMKVIWETRKIFGDENIPISCTCVRIPIMRAHSESIVVETEKPVNPDEVRKIFEKTPGIVVKDDIDNNVYPMPLTSSEKYDVEVGRIRQNLIFKEHGLEFFVSGDQLLKGAALNAVQIGELVVKERFS
ncbi:MAG: aspartate-semialdehyde dehydrogenase [Candidatus Woesearchaeota archaeon]|jgi:aspartate-semialdehyde dehydrogenase|nr:aspartate-semialdehyde dehydrogenase [Candidatus Woesearchaeota archaeon]MDP6265305.1 aspartate-semialdehyde dehydrogenase [Candidatus Woesearchaeota archaeon]MDP7476407.1 aspartate-semialdehyde dehydrogenase [Candidatus Woesearchaeota archaeon]HJO01564.1 aspartate-semialdehyde dehydrogenase [Candidatus Woesearchaeota archaeon]|tara:strand:+ start:215 stop:1228 length:1014 start_codon:yes stop_codon:yes gene_type:complete